MFLKKQINNLSTKTLYILFRFCGAGVVLGCFLTLFFAARNHGRLVIERIEAANKSFEAMVTKAKEVTNNPCGAEFVQTVFVEGSSEKPVTVIIGHVLQPTPEEYLDLRIKGEKVELWVLDTSSGTQKKFGERYNANSKFCEEYRADHTWRKNK